MGRHAYEVVTIYDPGVTVTPGSANKYSRNYLFSEKLASLRDLRPIAASIFIDVTSNASTVAVDVKWWHVFKKGSGLAYPDPGWSNPNGATIPAGTSCVRRYTVPGISTVGNNALICGDEGFMIQFVGQDGNLSVDITIQLVCI